MKKELLSVTEASDVTNRTRQAILSAIKRGSLNAEEMPGKYSKFEYKIKYNDLRDYMNREYGQDLPAYEEIADKLTSKADKSGKAGKQASKADKQVSKQNIELQDRDLHHPEILEYKKKYIIEREMRSTEKRELKATVHSLEHKLSLTVVQYERRVEGLREKYDEKIDTVRKEHLKEYAQLVYELGESKGKINELENQTKALKEPSPSSFQDIKPRFVESYTPTIDSENKTPTEASPVELRHGASPEHVLHKEEREKLNATGTFKKDSQGREVYHHGLTADEVIKEYPEHDTAQDIPHHEHDTYHETMEKASGELQDNIEDVDLSQKKRGKSPKGMWNAFHQLVVETNMDSDYDAFTQDHE